MSRHHISDQKIQNIIDQLTLEEKVHLCTGGDNWHIAGIERLGISPIHITDGPNGLRKVQTEKGDKEGKVVPTTCFPLSCTTACSFDVELLEKIGAAMGEECLQEEVGIILGPGCNIKRNPLCGRNFEYFSEDPLLSGKMAAALIRGIQSQNIGASVKHFAANNQEAYRMTGDSIVDERALREIYLKPFEIAVKEGNVSTVMCSYNKINGTYASEHKHLIENVLRGEFGFDGLMVSDWGAMNDWVDSLKAGMDLAMPGDLRERDQILADAVREGNLDISSVDKAVHRIVKVLLQTNDNKSVPYDVGEHDALAQKAVEESMVLLENNGILPLWNNAKLAVIGKFAKTPRYQGAGSSQIVPLKVTSFCDALEAEHISYQYADGIGEKDDRIDYEKIAEAVETAKEADVAIVFIGLPDSYEAEAYDRSHMELPQSHLQLIDEVIKTGTPVVVILSNGSPVSIPFRKQVDALFLAGLTGQSGGTAIRNLLLGKRCPSGRLSETYPVGLEDCASSETFGQRNVKYTESIYVGYRYYDTADLKVQYPFGYGLSYTKFSYTDAKLSRTQCTENDETTVSMTVTNTGNIKGHEVIQVYIEAPETFVYRPMRELKAFQKVLLEPGESKRITITLPSDSFAYYNSIHQRWHSESGIYKIQLGRSSRDIIQSMEITVNSKTEISVPDYRMSAPAYYNLTQGAKFPAEQFSVIYGSEFPIELPIRPYHRNSALGDLLENKIAGFIYKRCENRIMQYFSKMGDVDADPMDSKVIIENVVFGLPIRNLISLSSGQLTQKQIDGILDVFNGSIFKGVVKFINKRKGEHSNEKEE